MTDTLCFICNLALCMYSIFLVVMICGLEKENKKLKNQLNTQKTKAKRFWGYVEDMQPDNIELV